MSFPTSYGTKQSLDAVFLADCLDAFNAAKSVPGIAAHAKSEFNDPSFD